MMPVADSSSYSWSYIDVVGSLWYGPASNASGMSCGIIGYFTNLLRELARQRSGNESVDYEAILGDILHSAEFHEEFVSVTRPEWVMVYIFAAVFVLAIGGNFLVCFAVFRNEHMQTVTNYYIVNLAISDILMIILCMPATVMYDILESWYFGSLGCKLIPYFQYVSTSVSIFTLAAIAADRYLAICCPLKFHVRASRTVSIIVLIWTAAFIIPSPLIGFHEYEELVPEYSHLFPNPVWFSKCAETGKFWFDDPYHYSQKIYHVCLIFILYIIPLCIISVAYAMVCRRLWSAIPTEEARSAPSTFRAKKLLSAGIKKRHNAKSSTENQKESRRKVARMLIVLVCIFALCYFPVHMLNIRRFIMVYEDFDCDGMRHTIEMYLFILSHFLIYINSAANPIIYNFLSAKFRREFTAALCPFLQTKQRQMSYSRATLNTNSRTRRTISRESPRPSSNIVSTDCIRMTNIPKNPEA